MRQFEDASTCNLGPPARASAVADVVIAAVPLSPCFLVMPPEADYDIRAPLLLLDLRRMNISLSAKFETYCAIMDLMGCLQRLFIYRLVQ